MDQTSRRQSRRRASNPDSDLPMTEKLVVVVDDDWDVLTSLERLLNVSGFATETYSSGEAFLASTACSRASCLILDIHLGGMSGLELRRHLAASGSELPIIFMTAFNDEAARHAATEAGCIAFLRKPFPAKTLIAAIEAAA
jgi:FixJ family two-component response regulator